MGLESYAPPRPITQNDRLDDFSCGKPALDGWLKTHALASESRSARTYVVTRAEAVAAYYCLASGSVSRAEMPGKLRHGLPAAVPVMLLGRLAVDPRHTGHGLGGAMLKQAMQRTAQASQIAGVRALIVHAIDQEASGFYSRHGFQVVPAGGLTLLLPIETIIAAIA